MTTALALAAAREAAITDMMDRIVSGKSKISFDPSTTEEFRNQQIEYLKELAHTEVGFQLRPTWIRPASRRRSPPAPAPAPTR